MTNPDEYREALAAELRKRGLHLSDAKITEEDGSFGRFLQGKISGKTLAKWINVNISGLTPPEEWAEEFMRRIGRDLKLSAGE